MREAPTRLLSASVEPQISLGGIIFIPVLSFQAKPCNIKLKENKNNNSNKKTGTFIKLIVNIVVTFLKTWK